MTDTLLTSKTDIPISPITLSPQRGGKLLAKGSFGCVYSPALTCNLTELRNKNVVSKLQIADEAAEREIQISERIRTIPNYATMFSPVLETCPVSPSRLQTQFYDSCPVLKMTPAGKSVLLTRMKFIPGGLLFYHIYDKLRTPDCISALYSTFRPLIQSLISLRDVRVVHYDLADHNIMLNKDTRMPMIIDFGLSIDMQRAEEGAANINELRRWFYGYIPEVSFRAPEIHLLCYSLFVESTVTRNTVVQVTQELSKSHTELKLMKDSFRDMYKELTIKHLMRYVGMKPAEIFASIKQNEGTWDQFAVCNLYIGYLMGVIQRITSDKAFMRQVIERNTDIDVYQFLKEFTELLVLNIHPNPARRLTLEETLAEFDGIIYNAAKD